MSANSQTASPPSNAKEVSFSVVQMEYLHIFNQRKLVDIVNDLGPMLMADFGDGVKAAYPAKKVEEVLRKHLGISPDPVHSSPFTVHSSK